MSDEIDRLVQQVNRGDPAAQDRLFAAAYDELRRLARSRLRGGGRNTVLDTTALVHEFYLRLVRSGGLQGEGRRAFFAYASKVMRSVIVDSVRERQAERRGGDVHRVTLSTELQDQLPASEEDVLRIHDALDVLSQAEPRLAKVVEMRYFGGYSELEIAEALEVTDRTVRRDWEKAKQILAAILDD